MGEISPMAMNKKEICVFGIKTTADDRRLDKMVSSFVSSLQSRSIHRTGDDERRLRRSYSPDYQVETRPSSAFPLSFASLPPVTGSVDR